MKTLILTIFILLVYLGGFIVGQRAAGSFICPETIQDNRWWFNPHPIERYNIEE